MITRNQYDSLYTALALSLNTDEKRAKFVNANDTERAVHIAEVIVDNDLFDDATASKPFIDEFLSCWKIVHGLAQPVATKQCVWPKPKPPRMYPELVMRWPEEAAKIPTMAAKINFANAHHPGAIVNAVHEVLGIGGYLEALNGEQIPAADPTMTLFVQGVLTSLMASHVDWFDDEGALRLQLPQGADSRSVEEIDAAIEAENRARRAEVARKSAQARREKELKEKAERRSAAYVTLATTKWKELVDPLATLSFDQLRQLLTAPPVTSTPVAAPPDGMTWLPFEYVNEALAKLSYSPESLHFVETFILTKLRDVHPTWFKERQDGSLRIRKAPLKVREKGGIDRPTRTLRRKLARLIDKYGEAKVGDNLLALSGLGERTWAEVTGSLPRNAIA